MINEKALKDSIAVLEIQQGAYNRCLPYQGAICYCLKYTEVPFLHVQVIVAYIFLVCVILYDHK